jgi:hypothetical protein
MRKRMTIRKTVLAVMLAGLASVAARANTIEALYQSSAGNDMGKLRQQVEELAQLAKAEIDAHGIEAAKTVFRNAPWRRHANGLHLWGVSSTGIAWFDAGHPELERLVVSEMSDLNGLSWPQLALASANGSGEKTFEITFPHPVLKRAAKSLHQCFPIKDSDRVLCAGAYMDSE